MLNQAWKNNIQKFEKTGHLGVMPGRGLKQMSNETVEEVTFLLAKENSSSAGVGSRVLFLP